MVDAVNFESWLDVCKPDSTSGKGDLIESLRSRGTFGRYQSKLDGDHIILESLNEAIHIPAQDIEKLVEFVQDNVEVPDEDDLDEGLERALERRGNN